MPDKDALEPLHDEHRRAQASCEHARMMAREHGKAIISPRSSTTYTCFGMLIGGMLLMGLVYFAISSWHMSDLALQLTCCAAGIVGAAGGLFAAASIFYVDESLESNTMADAIKKSRQTVRSAYFK